MKTLMVILAVTTLAVTAYAECDYPYYPEYADVFSQYDEVTPMMAKKAAITSPRFVDNAGDVVCEPLRLVNCIGRPVCYMVATYGAEDLDIVKKWNEIIKNINTGKAMPAKSLAEEMGFYYSEDIIKDFNTLTIPPYTYDAPVVSVYGGFPALIGYVAAYKAAARSFGDDDFYFTGIIGAGTFTVQIFVFETDSGERLAFEVDENRKPGLADFEALREGSRRAVRYWYDGLIENPEIAERNVQRWVDLMDAVPDDQTNSEFPRVLESRAPIEEEDEEDVGGVLDKVPDPNRDLAWPRGSCYAWAPVLTARRFTLRNLNITKRLIYHAFFV